MKQFSELQRGVLPDTAIMQFLETHCIAGGSENCIQPASIDIRPDLNDIFEIKYFSPPRKGEKVETILKELLLEKGAEKIRSQLLQKGKRYLVRIREKIDGLPFYTRMNPKSSPGRLFLHSRLITDGHSAYDEIYPEHQGGSHWMMLSPKCFDIFLTEDEPLTQLRFFKGNDRLSRKELEREMSRNTFIDLPRMPELFDLLPSQVPVLGEDIASNLLTVDMGCDIVAYKTKNNDQPILISSRTTNPDQYFEPVYKDQVRRHGLVLEQEKGYLLGSLERIKLPHFLAAEVVPYSEKYGELRSHFAGFVDPGFGFGSPNGNSITFEIIAQEQGIAVRHGQSIAEIQYEYMSSEPKNGYAGNYKLQPSGPQLPKYFKK